jgi:hypothetical protein
MEIAYWEALSVSAVGQKLSVQEANHFLALMKANMAHKFDGPQDYDPCTTCGKSYSEGKHL